MSTRSELPNGYMLIFDEDREHPHYEIHSYDNGPYPVASGVAAKALHEASRPQPAPGPEIVRWPPGHGRPAPSWFDAYLQEDEGPTTMELLIRMAQTHYIELDRLGWRRS